LQKKRNTSNRLRGLFAEYYQNQCGKRGPTVFLINLMLHDMVKINKYFLKLKKKVSFVIFVVESLSNPGKSMSITKLSGKIGFKIFSDFEVP